MKNMIKSMTVYAAMAALPLGGAVVARAQDHEEHIVIVTNLVGATVVEDARPQAMTFTTEVKTDDNDAGRPVGSGQKKLVVRSIESDGDHGKARETTWLGLSVEESSEALSSQLGLKEGEGLTVGFIAPDSPAAKADFRKNDVLVEMDGQMLVDSTQLRKLVQMHTNGDTIKLTFFRGGRKQATDVKLVKHRAETAFNFGMGSSFGGMPNFELRLDDLNGKLHGMEDSLSRAGLDKVKMKMDLERALQQSSRAIQDSIRRASDLGSLTNLARELESLASNNVDMDKDATVTVRSKHNTNRTVVKTDDDGSIVYVAGGKKHLTAHDKDGKLIFDGNIDTPEQKAKVPKDVLEKLDLMLQQNTFDASGGADSSGSSGSSGTP